MSTGTPPFARDHDDQADTPTEAHGGRPGAVSREEGAAPGVLLFGRYRPVRELGRGGMGVVLEAYDEVLGIAVALKMVPETVLKDTEGAAELKKEILRGMALTHPGIVRVYSFEQDKTGAAIVMECVEGQSLARLKAAQPGSCFECEAILPWVEQLCGALEYAHGEARIAHRDLKPANILQAANGRLKIADFGIASSLSETLGRVSVRADSAGTPPYMSPQQIMGGRPSRLDDLYSLGATLYELLTGKPPFFRGNILAQALHEIPVSMAQRRLELGVLHSGPIPPDWEKAIQACLSKSADARPASAAAFLALLKGSAGAPPAKPKREVLRVATSFAPLPASAPAPKPLFEAPRFESPVTRRSRNARRSGALFWLAGACVLAAAIFFASQKWGAHVKAAAQPVRPVIDGLRARVENALQNGAGSYAPLASPAPAAATPRPAATPPGRLLSPRLNNPDLKAPPPRQP